MKSWWNLLWDQIYPLLPSASDQMSLTENASPRMIVIFVVRELLEEEEAMTVPAAVRSIPKTWTVKIVRRREM